MLLLSKSNSFDPKPMLLLSKTYGSKLSVKLLVGRSDGSDIKPMLSLNYSTGSDLNLNLCFCVLHPIAPTQHLGFRMVNLMILTLELSSCKALTGAARACAGVAGCSSCFGAAWALNGAARACIGVSGTIEMAARACFGAKRRTVACM